MKKLLGILVLGLLLISSNAYAKEPTIMYEKSNNDYVWIKFPSKYNKAILFGEGKMKFAINYCKKKGKNTYSFKWRGSEKVRGLPIYDYDRVLYGAWKFRFICAKSKMGALILMNIYKNSDAFGNDTSFYTVQLSSSNAMAQLGDIEYSYEDPKKLKKAAEEKKKALEDETTTSGESDDYLKAKEQLQ